ncbi:MAG: hypothetical protein IJ634_02900 [Bacteroidales bacterium]|nr:hypothetical protein [Bacteroidales bacterium]
MNIKKFLLTLLLLILGLAATAQSYNGNMEIDGYTRKNVDLRLARTPQGTIVLYMYNVKFARLMPVKVDMEIPGLTLNDGRLQGNGIIPTSKGKPYEKYRVTRFDGNADTEKITFTCLLGDKQMKFSGRRAKKNNTKNQ